ncbi:MAG: AraC family transcriptional regulator [Prevotella sp.]|nr:AraC family transcriptional regulator [Prevotella sp.]
MRFFIPFFLFRELGDTATNIIRRFLMQRAKELLVSGKTIAETSERLGFEYPQHFTRQFKSFYGITPTKFMQSRA